MTPGDIVRIKGTVYSVWLVQRVNDDGVVEMVSGIVPTQISTAPLDALDIWPARVLDTLS